MKQKTYNSVIENAKKLKSENIIQELRAKFPEISDSTLMSIYSQDIQRNVTKNFRKITQPNTIAKIYKRYCDAVYKGDPPGIISCIADDYNFSPAMMAKIILEHYLTIRAKAEGSAPPTKTRVKKLFRDTKLIEDKDLASEIFLCLLKDDVYGEFADSIKHSIGFEYEFLLNKKLDELDIGYESEESLRKQGYDKTPDVKLDMPIAVDGYVVNWIESKASFGDEYNHQRYLRDQYWSYWNRFGPGLVIYWFGFIEEFDNLREKGIVIKDCFPSNIVTMDPLV